MTNPQKTATLVVPTSVIDAIYNRHAVKNYQPDFVISLADENKLFDLARNSPTSFNLQNWRFVVVKDKALRQEIGKAAWGQLQVTEASLLIVMCADLKAFAKKTERYWEDAPKQVADQMVKMIVPFYEGREQMQRDEAMRSIGIAAQTLMLSAKAMGYDSCPMIGFDADAVGKLINLPSDHVVGMLLVIGKAAQPAHSKGGYLPLAEIVIHDRFASNEKV